MLDKQEYRHARSCTRLRTRTSHTGTYARTRAHTQTNIIHIVFPLQKLFAKAPQCYVIRTMSCFFFLQETQQIHCAECHISLQLQQWLQRQKRHSLTPTLKHCYSLSSCNILITYAYTNVLYFTLTSLHILNGAHVHKVQTVMSSI